jgi:hypothetical protein
MAGWGSGACHGCGLPATWGAPSGVTPASTAIQNTPGIT